MEIGPKEFGIGAVIGTLILFVVLLIENGGKPPKCNFSGSGGFPSCSASIDLSPSRNLSSPKYFAALETNGEFHQIDEPSSAYLFGLGDGLILFSKGKRGRG